MASILIIDDNRAFCSVLQNVAHTMEHDVTSVHFLEEGLRAARSGKYDVVFLGARMPEGSSLHALPKILASASSPEVIVVSDAGLPDEAEKAIKMGAWDYINRPTQQAMALPLIRALQYRARKAPPAAVTELKRETFGQIIGSSPQIQACLEVVAQAADSDASVLITGETGTGKELFAWAIHHNSARAAERFVTVDCAALTETLVESTLFGHEKGAFTGAEKGRHGLISEAHGGTLFLDEIGELPQSIQKSFLRVLAEYRFRPVGSTIESKSNFRLIAASNRDLDEMVRHKLFRRDLLFRLRSFSIELPPLREHAQDIPELVAHYAERLCREYGTAPKQLSPEFSDVLAKHHWPGNVRELVKALESAIVTARDEPVLYPVHLPNEIRAEVIRKAISDDTMADSGRPKGALHSPKPYPRLQEVREAALADAERNYLTELLSTVGDVREACRVSGLRRSRLYELLKKHGIAKRF